MLETVVRGRVSNYGGLDSITWDAIKNVRRAHQWFTTCWQEWLRDSRAQAKLVQVVKMHLNNCTQNPCLHADNSTCFEPFCHEHSALKYAGRGGMFQRIDPDSAWRWLMLNIQSPHRLPCSHTLNRLLEGREIWRNWKSSLLLARLLS